MSLYQKIKDLLKNKRDEISLKFDDNHLYYMCDNIPKGQFLWESVLEVFVFKRDLLSVDLICIGFRIDNNGKYYEIDEEMDNYKEVVNFLPLRFESIKEEWFSDVAFPPFETNLVSLWGDPLIERIWKV